jgi:hypothetical protein
MRRRSLDTHQMEVAIAVRAGLVPSRGSSTTSASAGVPSGELSRPRRSDAHTQDASGRQGWRHPESVMGQSMVGSA